MQPQLLAVIALAALVPIELYLLTVARMPGAAIASTVCVFLTAGAVYILFGGESVPAGG